MLILPVHYKYRFLPPVLSPPRFRLLQPLLAVFFSFPHTQLQLLFLHIPLSVKSFQSTHYSLFNPGRLIAYDILIYVI